jgi:5-methyltetrahydrofolate--homocysteine methyltransferase
MSYNNLIALLAELKEDAALLMVKLFIKAGDDPLRIVEACRKGMEIIGEKYETGEYFEADLMMAGEIFRKIMEILRPMIAAEKVGHVGKVVIGTMQNDIHDIGKNIVVFLLESLGFEVHDLGVDILPERFVEKVREVKPQVVGVSGLLTVAFESMKKTVEALKEAGLRDKVKIIIGGNPVNEKVARYVGSDAFANSAPRGINIIKKWVTSIEP